ncbi:MAG TPA: protein kinase [Vicinamibacterales bacterium]
MLKSFAPGSLPGAYAIVAPIGAGGMGQVFRARDTRLGREVALKLLAVDQAADPAGLERFEQEARCVAALNHPNIVALFDIGRHDGATFIVTELVDGSSLGGVRLPPRKAIDVAAQIADGLAAAHAAGVTHRDLKPDNVMVTRDGRVKILDFGVAKVTGRLAAENATRVDTGAGFIVGTAGYMAPEQVRAGEVDHRADIFSFGTLLYEVLTGVRAFSGETVADVMTAVLKDDPLDRPVDIPAGLRPIVSRCLEKKPQERFQSAQDLAFALRHLSGSSATASAIAVPAGKTIRREYGRITAAFVAGALAASGLVLRAIGGGEPPIDPVRLTRIAFDQRDEHAPAISPDGRSLAYLRIDGDTTEVLVRPLDALTPNVLVRSSAALSDTIWSADGTRVCYSGGREMSCVGAAGGTPRHVASDLAWPHFSPDGGALLGIRVADNRPALFRSAPLGSEPQRIDYELPLDVTWLSPVSPDGSTVIAITRSSPSWILPLHGGGRRPLTFDSTTARVRSMAWLPDNRHVVVAEEGTDQTGFRLVLRDTHSDARRLVARATDPITGVTVTPDGRRIVYAQGPVDRDIVELAGDGRMLRPVVSTAVLEGFPRWAPSGDRFVYQSGGPGSSGSLWIGDEATGAATLLLALANDRAGAGPVFSPDGNRIAYTDSSSGIYIMPASGGRPVQALASTTVRPPVCWTPDGESIWYRDGPPTSLAKLPLQGGAPVAFKGTAAVFEGCSPDGRWLLRRTSREIVLTSTDGAQERTVGSVRDYASPVAEFGKGGTLYLLRRDRRSIDVFDVATLRPLRTIAVELRPEDQVSEFSIRSDGARILASVGGERNDLWMAEGFATPATSWRRWLHHWN